MNSNATICTVTFEGKRIFLKIGGGCTFSIDFVTLIDSLTSKHREQRETGERKNGIY